MNYVIGAAYLYPGHAHRYKTHDSNDTAQQDDSEYIMEEFSEAARANALKFLSEFSVKPVPVIRDDAAPPLPLHWPHIADYELEGTVLDMARCYLAVK